MQRLSQILNIIENFSEWSGRVIAWLVLGMVVIVSYDVVMRYFFLAGSVALQELEWHLFSLLFLLGAAYTSKHDGHVRVDIFYNSQWMTKHRRAWLDLIGGLIFLTPFCLLIIFSSIPFITNSYVMSEGSPDPGGLPWRYLLKSAIPLGFFLLLLQGIAHMLRSVIVLMDKDS